jgi:acetaldehyde dehydrogenase (acetylating)
VLSLMFVADYATAMDTCFALLKFGGAGHTAVIYAKNDTRIREYGMRMPAMRVLVNTPAPQGSTGITTNVFPSMTLGCGAMAGNSTSDNVGPLHLINVKRLAYTVRTPEEAFEMPLDYDKAQDGPMPAASGGGAIDRATVVSAVERYLASRGVGVAAPTAPSCGCSTPAPAQPTAAQPTVQQSVVANVAAEVVDRFLARRGGAAGGSQKSGGYT